MTYEFMNIHERLKENVAKLDEWSNRQSFYDI